MTEVPTTMESLAGSQDACGRTGVVHDRDVVVLGTARDGQIEVYRDGVITWYEPGTTIQPVDEADRQAAALREALRAVTSQQAARIEEIRTYAIEKFLDGQFCREGLNEFLRTFGLEEYDSD